MLRAGDPRIANGGAVMVPFPIWHEAFINDADLTLATSAYERLNPHPYKTFTDKAQLKQPLAVLEIGKSYVNCMQTSAAGEPALAPAPVGAARAVPSRRVHGLTRDLVHRSGDDRAGGRRRRARLNPNATIAPRRAESPPYPRVHLAPAAAERASSPAGAASVS